MLAWLSANAGTITVGMLVVAVAAMALRSLIKGKKQGGCDCGGCPGCASRDSCPAGKNK